MGLGILEDHHLQHVPGTALLADMLEERQHQYHGNFLLFRFSIPSILTSSRPRHVRPQARVWSQRRHRARSPTQ